MIENLDLETSTERSNESSSSFKRKEDSQARRDLLKLHPENKWEPINPQNTLITDFLAVHKLSQCDNDSK
jgi:hypothetical protein